MSASPQKPKLTAKLVAFEIEAVAEGIRRLGESSSMRNGEDVMERKHRLAERLERLAAALNGGGHG